MDDRGPGQVPFLLRIEGTAAKCLPDGADLLAAIDGLEVQIPPLAPGAGRR